MFHLFLWRPLTVLLLLCGALWPAANLLAAAPPAPASAPPAAAVNEAALKQAAKSGSSTRKHRNMENLLVISETAFALILLAGAGLLMRTFDSLPAALSWVKQA